MDVVAFNSSRQVSLNLVILESAIYDRKVHIPQKYSCLLAQLLGLSCYQLNYTKVPPWVSKGDPPVSIYTVKIIHQHTVNTIVSYYSSHYQCIIAKIYNSFFIIIIKCNWKRCNFRITSNLEIFQYCLWGYSGVIFSAYIVSMPT